MELSQSIPLDYKGNLFINNFKHHSTDHQNCTEYQLSFIMFPKNYTADAPGSMLNVDADAAAGRQQCTQT